MSVHTKKLAGGRTAYEVKLRDPVGRQYSRTFRTRKEAEAFQTRERSSRLTGSWIDPRGGEVHFGAFADQWLRNRVGLRPRTQDLYSYLLRHHLLPTFKDLPLNALTPARVRAWHSDISKGTVGSATVAKAYRLLRTILATAVEDELLTRNPCVLKGASAERPAERPVATLPQLSALTDAVDRRYRAMVLLAAWTGLRYGELAALRVRDVDLVSGRVHVGRQLQEAASGRTSYGPPKSDAGYRTIAIPPHVIPVLEAHPQLQAASDPEHLVFPAPNGKPLRRSNFNRRVWQPACQQAKVNGLRFHDLRHTGNTLAATTGASTKELMVRMGHASSRAALIYQHGSADRDQAIAEALSRLAEGG